MISSYVGRYTLYCRHGWVWMTRRNNCCSWKRCLDGMIATALHTKTSGYGKRTDKKISYTFAISLLLVRWLKIHQMENAELRKHHTRKLRFFPRVSSFAYFYRITWLSERRRTVLLSLGYQRSPLLMMCT